MEQSLMKKIYAGILGGISKILGADRAKQFDARFRFGRRMNIKNPRSLAEKAAYLELYHPMTLKSTCTDKWTVRDYVACKGLEDILIPTYGVYTSEQLPWEKLPEQFVLKATHGCKMNLICTEKQMLNRKDAEKRIKGWLSTDYGTYSIEPHYLEIPHRIYIEQYLGSPETMVDYKFYCYHGTPSFVEVCSERGIGLKLNLYNMRWERIDEVLGEKRNERDISCPKQLEQMKQICQILAKDFLFVRVDLYLIQEKIYFGELTFTPSNCVFPNFTEAFLFREGEKLDITDVRK